VAATSVTIMVAAGLWERSPHRSAREQVILFNVVTAVTVGIGVAVLYAAILVAMLAAALLLVPAGLLGSVARPSGRRGRRGAAGLAGHLARHAGRRARRRAGNPRDGARSGLQLPPDTQLEPVDRAGTGDPE
jgi:hypothetical protein